MGWADEAIAKLKAGETVQIRPRGESMTGRIESGDLVTIRPMGDELIDVGQIVLCKCNGVQYLHIVKEFQLRAGRWWYLIGNNRGRINGWITEHTIYGVVTDIVGS